MTQTTFNDMSKSNPAFIVDDLVAVGGTVEVVAVGVSAAAANVTVIYTLISQQSNHHCYGSNRGR